MHATWLPRSSNNISWLSQHLRIPLLAPPFPRPRAFPPRRPTRFSTSAHQLKPQAEPEPDHQSESLQETRHELLDALQDIQHSNRSPRPARKYHSDAIHIQPPKARFQTSKSKKPFRVEKFESHPKPKPDPPPVDYIGQYVHPTRDGFIPDNKLPWYEASLIQSLPLVRLNQELNAVADLLLPSEKERAARNAVAEDVLTLFTINRNKALHGFGLEAFGSEVNSLATVTSDLDFRLFDRNVYSSSENDSAQAPRYEQRKRSIHALTQLRVALKHIHRPPVPGSRDAIRHPYLFSVPTLLHARYPLIETRHLPTQIDIQIVCCNDPSHSLRTMDKYMEEIPYIQTVYVVLRRTLSVRGLTDVFHGGVGSYTLFYMIVAALKNGPSPMPSTAGEALLQVLGFYVNFDSDKNWISIDPPQISEKAQPPDAEGSRPLVGTLWPERPYLLSIQDPADPTNDIPRQAFAWRHIRTTFAVLRKELTLRLKMGDERLLLVPFVGRWFEDVQVKRESLLMYQRLFSIGKMPFIEEWLESSDQGVPETSASKPSDAGGAQDRTPSESFQESVANQERQESVPESHAEINEQKAAEAGQESAATEGSQPEPPSEREAATTGQEFAVAEESQTEPPSEQKVA